MATSSIRRLFPRESARFDSRRATTLVPALMLVLVLLGGCGGSDEVTPVPTATNAPAVLPTTQAPTVPPGEEPTPTVAPTVPPLDNDDNVRFPPGDPLMGLGIEDAESEGGILVEGWAADLKTLNPVLADDAPSLALLQMIFEPLIELHPDTLEPVGVLAESWEASDGGLTWTFHLRDGVTWHDGEPFTANDVKVTYDLLMNDASESSSTGDLQSKITDVEVIDPLTITFTLPLPDADFAVEAATHAIIPGHIWRDVPPEDIASDPGSTGEDVDRVIGTGPFIFSEWLTGDRATVSANAEYWGGEPHLEQYIFKVVPDQTAGIEQLKIGEIDWLSNISVVGIEEFEEVESVRLVDVPTTNFTFYGLNLDPAHTTLFRDVSVRQALLIALDREALVVRLRSGFGDVPVGTIPTVSWAYDPDAIEPELRYGYDPNLARQLLDDAGWVEGVNGIRQKGSQRLEFSVITDASDPLLVAYVNALQKFWSEIGVEMTPEAVPYQTLVERIAETFDYEAFVIGFSWDATPDQSSMFACDSYEGGFNVMHYCNDEVDALLGEARVETDTSRRIALYAEYQNTLLADLPVAILDFPRRITGINTRIHNLYPSSVNERFNAETWWVED